MFYLIYSDISSGIFADILSDTYSDILSDIVPDIVFATPFDEFLWHPILTFWHSSLTCIRTYYPTSILTFYDILSATITVSGIVFGALRKFFELGSSPGELPRFGRWIWSPRHEEPIPLAPFFLYPHDISPVLSPWYLHDVDISPMSWFPMILWIVQSDWFDGLVAVVFASAYQSRGMMFLRGRFFARIICCKWSC